MEDDKISVSEEHSEDTNSVDSQGKPSYYRFPLPFVAIPEPEYRNGVIIISVIIISVRAGIALFNGCRIR